MVVGGVDPPEKSEVLCVSAAAAHRGRLFDAPAWRYEPPLLNAGMNLQRLKPYHPETWRCSLWQVGGGCAVCFRTIACSFLAWAMCLHCVAVRNHLMPVFLL